MCGPDSVHRKNAALRGLFMEASPLEGKYIARTALCNMLVGIGPKTMISAISLAFHCHLLEVQRAYNVMPDLGSIACAAYNRDVNGIKLQPSIPIRPMLIRPGDAVIPGAYQPRYSGLRVQVHMKDKDIFIFTNRLRNITSSLNSLSKPLGEIDRDFIIDAYLVGFQEDRICSQAEIVRHINRRRLSRKSRVSPALMAYDLMYLDGEDITSIDYRDRRKKLLSIVGEPKGLPYMGISAAKEELIENPLDGDRYMQEGLSAGLKRWIIRDLNAPYRPGEKSSQDFLIMR